MRHSTNRRQFLTLALGAAATATCSLGRRPASAGRRGTSERLETVTRQARALGTKVTITVLHANRPQGVGAVDAAFQELDLVEDLMSLYRPQSQLCQLNRQGFLRAPHPYLVEVLTQAATLSRKTHGAFDVTVQPLWQLYDECRRANSIPDEERIAAARAHVDWRRVSIHNHGIQLTKPSTRITLNGIAQGFAADRVARVLRDSGIEFALINTGEIGTVGGKGAEGSWKIGIQHPRDADAFVSLAHLSERCLATSGDYESTFSPDYRNHHLLDPHTGISPTELSSVSVAARTAIVADALSTAVFVLGPRLGLQLVRATAGADALLILKNGSVQATDGFPQGARP